MVKRLLAFACALAACSQDSTPLTQLVLVADTDISSLDSVQFVLDSPTEGTRMATATRMPGQPSTLSVVHEHGPLGPITVSARGMHAGTVVVERTQQLSFVADQTRDVLLHLFASCIGVSCAAGQTCDQVGCVNQALGESELSVWTGQAPHLIETDASVGDAGQLDAATGDASVDNVDSGPARDSGNHGQGGGDAAPEAGSPDDAAVTDAALVDAASGDAATDASLLTQCGDAGLFDLSSDVNHCGRCNKSCNLVTESCVAGTCTKK